MDSPPYLLDQYAKSRGVSAAMAKRAIMLLGFSDEGRKLKDAARSLKIAESSAKKLCRRFMIDFPDYRPYARLEQKGEPRPAPYVRPDQSPETLPLFGAA